MAKTAKQVQTDIINLLKNSLLDENTTGNIYRKGYRPRDSRNEDIIVSYTTGLPDEVQTGVVTINIFIPNIDPYADGILVENGLRSEYIESLAQEWVDSLPNIKSKTGANYLFELQQTIYTENEPEIKQHFVVVKLKYRLYE